MGPKLGLTILSGMAPGPLVDAITSHSVTGLSRVPGIGKKTAERIILELKDKMAGLAASASSASKGDAAPAGSLIEDAISGLEALGYGKTVAEKNALEAIRENPSLTTSSAIITEVLKRMNR